MYWKQEKINLYDIFRLVFLIQKIDILKFLTDSINMKCVEILIIGCGSRGKLKIETFI